MKKSELREMLKPLIRELIKEVIYEDKGVLSHIISETAKGLSSKPVFEDARLNSIQPPSTKEVFKEVKKKNNKILSEKKKRLMDALGKDSYGGVNIFENVNPLKSAGSENPSQDKAKMAVAGPLGDVDPEDPGVDLAIFAEEGLVDAWKQQMGNK